MRKVHFSGGGSPYRAVSGESKTLPQGYTLPCTPLGELIRQFNEKPNFSINRKFNRQKAIHILTVECNPSRHPALPPSFPLHQDSLVRIGGLLLLHAVLDNFCIAWEGTPLFQKCVIVLMNLIQILNNNNRSQDYDHNN